MTDAANRHTAASADRAIALAKATFDIEAAAVLGLKSRIGPSFAQAVELILALKGRVVVMGMGKSGHIGRKIVATLASTGTPAMFVHPAEASHGDLGMITAADLVLAISNSGESQEMSSILPVLKRLGAPMVAMTANGQSTMARHADLWLDTAVDKEACPLNLAPTASTTAQLALGDALAVALLDARGFRAEDFARSHPGGALGRKLLTHVSDVMRSGDAVPRVPPDANFSALMREMRRLLEQGADLRGTTAQEVMHRAPSTIDEQALAVDAVELMERNRITSVLVVDAEGRLCGALNSNDLMRAKVI